MLIDLCCSATGRKRGHLACCTEEQEEEGRLGREGVCLSSLGSCRAPLLLEIAVAASGAENDGLSGSGRPRAPIGDLQK